RSTQTSAGRRTRATRRRSTSPRCASTARASCTGAAGPCRSSPENLPRSCSRPDLLPAPAHAVHDGGVSSEDLENYETDMELALYREYHDVVNLFSYVLETERRFYLANHVDLQLRTAGGEAVFKVTLADACAC